MRGVGGDQCEFVSSAQRFDCGLSCERRALGLLMLGISHRHRSAVFRVFCASAGVVLLQPPLQVVRDAGVQTLIRALQDIDDPFHAGDSVVGQERPRLYLDRENGGSMANSPVRSHSIFPRFLLRPFVPPS